MPKAALPPWAHRSTRTLDASKIMNHDTSKLESAIDRNFAEVSNALLKLTAYNALHAVDPSFTNMSFFQIAEQALFNDMVASAIRVLDEHRDAAGLPYVLKCNEAATRKALASSGVDVDAIWALSRKLEQIRDKSHFHIDRNAVKRPEHVWESADIDGGHFSEVLRSIAKLLAAVKQEIFGGTLEQVTFYDGSDVSKIIEAYEQVHGSQHGV